jgi:hypothetical protein
MNSWTEKDEKALRALLARASPPELPQDAERRLMATVASVPQTGNVVSLADRRKPARMLWVGLPLAASVALGIFLGTQQMMDTLLPSFGSAGLNIELPSVLDDQDDGSLDDLS